MVVVSVVNHLVACDAVLSMANARGTMAHLVEVGALSTWPGR